MGTSSVNPHPKRARGRRREEILEAALALIAREGFAAATHRRVAAEADVPLGSTTYYFESREDLLREAFRRYLTEISEILQEGAARLKEAPSIPRLLDFLIRLTEREAEDETMILLEYELVLFAARDGSLAEELHAWQDGLVRDLGEALAALGARRPREAAHTVIQLVRGHEVEQLTRGKARSRDLRRRLSRVLGAYLETT